MKEKMIQIYAPHFCAGVVVKNGTVISAAPIVRYMLSWNEKKVKDYSEQKKWTYKEYLEA